MKRSRFFQGFLNRGHAPRQLFAAGTLAALALGCSEGDAADPELVGVAELAITAPAGVSSVSVDFAGTSRTVSRCIAVDGKTVTRVQGLPTGAVALSASAFSGSDCSGDAVWLAESQLLSLVAGRPSPVRLVFRPNGIAEIETDFVGDEAPGCPAEVVRVPRAAMALTANQPGGTGLSAVYSDGDVRIEGPIDFGPYSAGYVPSYYPADVLADADAPALWETIWGIGGETLTGYIIAPRSGPVTFTISADDYASLDLGDGVLSLLADNTGVASGTAMLEAGVYYPVTLEYQNRWGSNWFRFYWQCPVE